ncbi:MAG: DNA polymerase III subunit delta [Planctomycetota bacterium]
MTAAKRRTFLTEFVAPRHQARLAAPAADALIEMLGEDCGFLDTEIAKLSLYLEPGETITEPLVREVVAGWQGKTIWQITEAITSGDAAEAIKQLDKLMAGGQPAIALLPQIAWSLRRLGLATAAHVAAERNGGRPRLEDSLERAGVRSFEVGRVKSDLRRMKREKASQLLGWLLDADLRLKGTHSADGRDRFLLEQFVTRLARN